MWFLSPLKINLSLNLYINQTIIQGMKYLKGFNEQIINESFKTKAQKLIDDTKKLKDDYPEKKYIKKDERLKTIY